MLFVEIFLKYVLILVTWGEDIMENAKEGNLTLYTLLYCLYFLNQLIGFSLFLFLNHKYRYIPSGFREFWGKNSLDLTFGKLPMFLNLLILTKELLVNLHLQAFHKLPETRPEVWAPVLVSEHQDFRRHRTRRQEHAACQLPAAAPSSYRTCWKPQLLHHKCNFWPFSFMVPPVLKQRVCWL